MSLRRALALTLMLLGALASDALQAGNRLAYLTGSNPDGISVVDVDALVLLDTFLAEEGASPVDVAVSPDHQFIYLSRVDGTIEKRWRADGGLVDAISIGLQAQELVLAADGSRLYIAGHDGITPAVIVRAADTLAGLASIALPDTGFGLALSPDGARLYASSPSDDSISVIDTDTDTLLDTILVGRNPQGVAVSADGTRLHAGTHDATGVSTLSVIDTGSGQMIDEITFGNATLTAPFFIALSVSRAYVTVAYVSPGPFEALGVVDLETGTPLPGVDLGTAQATGIERLPDGRLLIAAGGGLDQLLVYDSATLMPLGAVDVGPSPRGLAWVDLDSIFADGFDD